VVVVRLPLGKEEGVSTMTKGWKGEREAHGLCAKGITVRRPRLRAGGFDYSSVVASAVEQTVDEDYEEIDRIAQDILDIYYKYDVYNPDDIDEGILSEEDRLYVESKHLDLRQKMDVLREKMRDIR